MLKKRTKASTNFELMSWLFMRVSGSLLIVLVLVHIGMVHYVHTVEKINYAMVAERWSTPTWRIYDVVMMVLALFHGGNGIRILADDYIRSSGWRTAVVSALYTVVFLVLAFGAIVIFTFKS